MKAEIGIWSLAVLFVVLVIFLMWLVRRPRHPRIIHLTAPKDPGPPPGVVHSNVIYVGPDNYGGE